MFNYPSLRNNELFDFRRELDRFFEDFWSTSGRSSGNDFGSGWSPLSEIEEEEGHYLLSIEVPGMKKEDLRIEVMENQVVISGERKQEEKHKGKGGTFSDRRYGRFQRAFALPTHVDANKIEAHYQDGVLKVYVPKSEAAKPRQIQIGDSTSGGGFFSKLLGREDKSRNTIEHASKGHVA